MTGAPPLLEARGIVKRFGDLLANDVAHFSVGAGEVLALLGENGAGKSTLAKILYGYYAPDAGEIRVDGRQVEIASPRDARALGIGLGLQKNLPAVVPHAEILERMRHYAERFRLAVDPFMPARQLAVGDQQKVEILKQLLAGARVLILDQATKGLAPQESEGLFKTLAELRAEGMGIVLITHKLREVLACADRIAAMRHRRGAGVCGPRGGGQEKLLSLMFGDAPIQPAPLLDPVGRH